jgi:hypothetical protein
MLLNLIHGYCQVCARLTCVILVFVLMRADGSGVWNRRLFDYDPWFGVTRPDLNTSWCLYERAVT